MGCVHACKHKEKKKYDLLRTQISNKVLTCSFIPHVLWATSTFQKCTSKHTHLHIVVTMTTPKMQVAISSREIQSAVQKELLFQLLMYLKWASRIISALLTVKASLRYYQQNSKLLEYINCYKLLAFLTQEYLFRFCFKIFQEKLQNSIKNKVEKINICG